MPSNLVKRVNIDVSGAVGLLDPGPDDLSMKILGLSGKIAGQFIHPVTGRATKINGVVIQKQQMGGGNLLGTDQSGFVLITPSP